MEDTKEIKKPSFWIGQLCVIVATVLGVFLAATQGFEQAMKFDAIQSEKSNYYLRKSLQSEMADNVSYIREYIKRVEDNYDRPELILETFVWRSMTYSPISLEVPSEMLRETQRFYRQAAEIMDAAHYNIYHRAKLLGELADHMEQKVLPKFEDNTQSIKKWLKSYNVEV